MIPLLTADTQAAAPVPSIAIDALLAQRDAAAAHLRAISEAVQGYHAIGAAIWTEDLKPRGAYAFLESVSQRASGRGASLDSGDRWLEGALQSLDASMWDHLLNVSGLWTFFDSRAREEWRKQIEERKTPALTADNIRATFEALHARRGEFFERGVCELFRSLSWDYKTNRPIAFGKRIILRGVCGSDGRPGSYSRCDKLDDLDRALHILADKPEPDHRSSIQQRLWNREPRHAPIETPFLRLRTFKNGNGHVEFLRPDLVDRLNRILAKHHPNALAPSRDDA